MPQIIWTPQAIADVQRLFRFLATHNLNTASRAIDAIRESVKILELQPWAGRPVEEKPENYKEWPIKFGDSGYVALYRIEKNKIPILSIRHQREAGW
ncbi:type II toxin-antitoxin system RelE/ParE family toxin [Salmonella enterica subsp. enterica serovar Panama]|uniref:Type II toxin-antitoxin system RelE/ParE family toxin n=1 Tax=Salmonella enterica subsp. enterica serovar Panama TaxID=29472 RepID=A0A636GFN9_SALET|nr:type II toxin-antitoxin system RelE/ParE family toxin [Salmonella enterica subsp. enterica serovar Panama]EDI0274285.1 type II toxin-antitoxin system RelE/ParE family toxin [Salmonella enterica subsp. enterica serovar Panama]